MAADKKEKKMTGILAVLLVSAALISSGIGSYPLSVPEILRILTGSGEDAMAAKVFFSLRLPRVLTGAMAGAVLGLCGAVFQLIFRNPLASPDLVGVAQGAGLGAACGIVFGGGSMAAVMAGGFFGGMAALAAVFLVVALTGSSRAGTLILNGVMISSLANALLMLLKHMADPEGELAAIEFWTMGSLSAVTSGKLAVAACVCLPPFFLLFVFHREILLLGLGDEQATAMGLAAARVRKLLLVLATLAVSGVICVTGVLSFVGLLAPHGAFLLLQRRNRCYLAASAVSGAILVLAADCFARSLTEGELPLSVLTTFCVFPLFLFLLRKRKGGLL